MCRLHAVPGELIPGGVPRAITAARAARILKAISPAGAVETARLTPPGRVTLAGIASADSIVLDPHKGMFLP